MHIVIDIPEDIIESAKSSPNYYPTYHFEKIWKAIVNGTPLPKDHERLIILSEDAVSRESVNTLVDELARAISDERCHCPKRGRETGEIMSDILHLPSVYPKPKVGMWLKIKPYPMQMHEYECSECMHETDDNTENYCSECGAKMESEG